MLESKKFLPSPLIKKKKFLLQHECYLNPESYCKQQKHANLYHLF